MEKYADLEVVFLKKHYYPHLFLTLLLCLLSGFFMSFRNLDQLQAARVMEMYVILSGIILLVPIFMPQQDQEIWDLERSKAFPMWKLYVLRSFTAVVSLFLVVSFFTCYLTYGNNEVDGTILFLGSMCQALFLGSTGFFVSAVTNQAVLGYMISILYFAVNIGMSKYLGVFGLFHMMQGEKPACLWLLLGTFLLMMGGIVIRQQRE